MFLLQYYFTQSKRILCACAIVVATLVTWDVRPRSNNRNESVAPRVSAIGNRTVATGAAAGYFRNLPLRFEPNNGQADRRVKFLSRYGAHTSRYGAHTLLLTSEEAVLTVHHPAGAQASEGILHLKWTDINNQAEVTGIDELPGKTNYLLGSAPGRWRTGIPTYGKVSFRNVYPGVDLVYYGVDGRLEYDLVLAPGAQADKIRFALHGGDRMQLGPNGDLIVGDGESEIRFHKPYAYQPTSAGGGDHEARNPVSAQYLLTSHGEVRSK